MKNKIMWALFALGLAIEVIGLSKNHFKGSWPLIILGGAVVFLACWLQVRNQKKSG
jgi:hypothetical protein